LTLKLLYIVIKEHNMKRKKTKDNITISLDRTLSNIVNDTIANRSKYVEWVIYQDILKNSKDNRVKEVII